MLKAELHRIAEMSSPRPFTLPLLCLHTGCGIVDQPGLNISHESQVMALSHVAATGRGPAGAGGCWTNPLCPQA